MLSEKVIERDELKDTIEKLKLEKVERKAKSMMAGFNFNIDDFTDDVSKLPEPEILKAKIHVLKS